MNKYSLEDTLVVIYTESCAEFEHVRDICLLEDNWLRDNYTRENLIVENHHGYGVVYQASTMKPMVMCGVFNDGRYPDYVAKMCSRLYTFPEFRMTRTQMVDAFRIADLLVNHLIRVNKFETYFISMQNREGRPNKRWWDAWVSSMNSASNDAWTLGEGYIQTCPHNVQKCWQNYVYKGDFTKWNPKTILDNEWLLLEVGK